MFRKGKSFSHVARGRSGWWTAAVAVLLTTIGFAHDGGFFSEFRIGGGNTPSLKIGAGYRVKF